MIRDPSDGSVRPQTPEPPGSRGVNPGCAPHIDDTGPLIDTSTSGLPITKAKAAYLARLEESRRWLKAYVRSTINA